MAIYMKYPGIEGTVTYQGHAKWIEINNFQLGAHRYISSGVGNVHDRDNSIAHVDEITFEKKADHTSPAFFNAVVAGVNAKEVKIVFVNKDKSYDEYTLTNARISNFVKQSSDGSSSVEHISINFTKIEMAYTSRNDEGKDLSVVRKTYNLEDGKAS